MKKRNFRTNSVPRPTIRTAFEQFQRQNTIKNLSQGTIEFYSAKSKYFFMFLGDTERCIDTITEEDIEDYTLFFKAKGTVSDTTINTNLRMVSNPYSWRGKRSEAWSFAF